MFCKMSIKASVQYATLLATVWQAVEVTSSKVDQFPAELTVHGGGNASMFCIFSMPQTIPNVSWWRRGEKRPVEPDGRKQFTVKKGGATFVILNARATDSGMYYCKVKYQQKSIVDGPGSNLTVFIRPTPLKIALVEERSPPSRKLVCKTAPFYPEDLKLSWLRNNVRIQTGIENRLTRSMEGLYLVSSFLEITQPTWAKDVYTCLVSHASLTKPDRVNYMFEPDSQIALILGCVGGLAILVLIIILAKFRLKASRDVNTNSLEPSQSVEPAGQAPIEHTTAYAALSLSKDKGFTKGRREEENVIYSQMLNDTLNSSGNMFVAPDNRICRLLCPNTLFHSSAPSSVGRKYELKTLSGGN